MLPFRVRQKGSQHDVGAVFIHVNWFRPRVQYRRLIIIGDDDRDSLFNRRVTFSPDTGILDRRFSSGWVRDPVYPGAQIGTSISNMFRNHH